MKKSVHHGVAAACEQTFGLADCNAGARGCDATPLTSYAHSCCSMLSGNPFSCTQASKQKKPRLRGAMNCISIRVGPGYKTQGDNR